MSPVELSNAVCVTTVTLYRSLTHLVTCIVGELQGMIRQLKPLAKQTRSQSFGKIPSGPPVKNNLVSLHRKCMDESDGISVILSSALHDRIQPPLGNLYPQNLGQHDI